MLRTDRQFLKAIRFAAALVSVIKLWEVYIENIKRSLNKQHRSIPDFEQAKSLMRKTRPSLVYVDGQVPVPNNRSRQSLLFKIPATP